VQKRGTIGKKRRRQMLNAEILHKSSIHPFNGEIQPRSTGQREFEFEVSVHGQWTSNPMLKTGYVRSVRIHFSAATSDSPVNARISDINPTTNFNLGIAVAGTLDQTDFAAKNYIALQGRRRSGTSREGTIFRCPI